MDNQDELNRSDAFSLYVSQPYDCSYLPDKTARTLFIDPSAELNPTAYQWLIDRGFRRSGPYLYQPACPDCAASFYAGYDWV